MERSPLFSPFAAAARAALNKRSISAGGSDAKSRGTCAASTSAAAAAAAAVRGRWAARRRGGLSPGRESPVPELYRRREGTTLGADAWPAILVNGCPHFSCYGRRPGGVSGKRGRRFLCRAVN